MARDFFVLDDGMMDVEGLLEPVIKKEWYEITRTNTSRQRVLNLKLKGKKHVKHW